MTDESTSLGTGTDGNIPLGTGTNESTSLGTGADGGTPFVMGNMTPSVSLRTSQLAEKLVTSGICFEDHYWLSAHLLSQSMPPSPSHTHTFVF
ncbi:hypothetical protein CDAR_567651 [Caerostris darwini]|uniref:Uncharacterized protein n=1 Tax=Caerostris darwini TaxID=1538125 RepID=A0AAV4R001_9ARAC|nr:hypothetical protein CDAR_567651 [Caerostris darwini]